MATLVDANDFKREATVIEADEATATESSLKSLEEPTEQPEVAPEAPQDDLPDKYKGKSAADLARMHQELEKRLGQQGQEVGQLRQAFDEMVKASVTQQHSNTPAPEAPEATLDDAAFFADPVNAAKQAAQEVLKNDPVLRQAQEVSIQMAQQSAMQRLMAAHPDAQEVAANPAFREYIESSPIRKDLYARAEQQFDFDAANELFTGFKATQNIAKQQASLEKQATKQAAKEASTGSARSAPNASTGKKVLRRADIIALMRTDPKRYEALLPEIKQAYAEGRVK